MFFWLKGEEDPGPATAHQYFRWRKLRKLQQANEPTQPSTTARDLPHYRTSQS